MKPTIPPEFHLGTLIRQTNYKNYTVGVYKLPIGGERNFYFTPYGDFMGDRWVMRMCKRLGLTLVQKREPDHHICSIGWCKFERKWYGWSHRSLCGFGLGDRIFEWDYGNDNTPFITHGGRVIKAFDEAKLSAARFADYVG